MKSFLRNLIDDEGPALFHCTAGKDRAGFAAAITLIALGVSKERSHSRLYEDQSIHSREN